MKEGLKLNVELEYGKKEYPDLTFEEIVIMCEEHNKESLKEYNKK